MAIKTSDCAKETVPLLRELLREIGDLQDGSYISDGMAVMTKTEFFDAVRVARKRVHRTARRIDKFLRKHGEPLRVTG